MMGLSDGRKSVRIGLAVLIQYRSVTDTQPRCRSYYAQRSGVEPKKQLLYGLDDKNSAWWLTAVAWGLM